MLTYYVVPLTREDIVAARAYYEANKEEVDSALRRNEEV